MLPKGEKEREREPTLRNAIKFQFRRIRRRSYLSPFMLAKEKRNKLVKGSPN